MLFINAGERSFSKNENELETCSAVYSLFTIDHFLYYIFFILSQEKKNTLFGQYDKLHNLNVKQQRVRVNDFLSNLYAKKKPTTTTKTPQNKQKAVPQRDSLSSIKEIAGWD